jgi:hypothetical protein
MMKRACLIFAVLLLGACDSPNRAEAVMLGPYTARLAHDPAPLKVGYDADFRLLLQDSADKGVNDCNVTLRQYMPGMDMDTDQTGLDMRPAGDGVYTVRSHEFRMGGDWEIELTVDCGDGPLSHTYSYTLEWPE